MALRQKANWTEQFAKISFLILETVKFKQKVRYDYKVILSEKLPARVIWFANNQGIKGTVGRLTERRAATA